MERSNLMCRLYLAEHAMGLHLNANHDPLLIYRLKKILHHPYRALRLALAKRGIGKIAATRTFFDSRLILPLSDVNAADLFYSGCLRKSEGYVTRFLIENLKKGQVFYDIGANYGFYSALARSFGCTVHAFDPSPHCLSYLKKNIPAPVILNPVALSNVEDTLTLYDMSHGRKSGMSTTNAKVATSSKVAFKQVPVATITLDLYVSNNPIPAIIKLDTEGAEARVLVGGKTFLTEHSPVIVLEIWGSKSTRENSEATLRILKEAGYDSYRIEEDGNISPIDIQLDTIGENNNFVFKKV